MTPSAPSPGQLHTRVFAASASLLIALLLLAGAVQEGRFSHRLLGFILAEDAESPLQVEEVLPDGSAFAAGLAAGDVILAIGGREITTTAEYDQLARGFRHGMLTSVVVARGGERVELQVNPGYPFRWLPEVLNAAACLAYLLLGLVPLWHNREDLRARLLCGFAVAVAFELATPLFLDDMPWWTTFARSMVSLLIGLQVGLELHLAALIPRPAPWIEQRPRLLWLIYGPGAVLGLVTAAAALHAGLGLEILPFTYTEVRTFDDNWGLPLWSVALIAILVGQVRRSADDRRGRNQALLVLAGVLPWALFSFAISPLGQRLFTATPGLFSTVQPLILLAYPIAVFIAIFRYNLLDIELVLRRSIVYSIVTTVLIGIMYSVLAVGGALFAHQADQRGASIWGLAAALLVLGMAFTPLREIVQKAVDRNFFPERLAMRHSLTLLAAKLPAEGNLTAMGRQLVLQVRTVLGVRSATVLVADPRSGVLVSLASTAVDLTTAFDRSFLLAADDPAVLLLARSSRPMRSAQLERVSPAFAQRMLAFDAEIALALSSGGAPIGMLVLGGKSSGDRFTADELDLLSLFSYTVAGVLENARLYESATYEGLTGLLRREAILTALERELERARRYGRPLTVGMADIDHFKRVNDQLGHLAGDAMLKRVAQALAHALRTSDLIGRYGGEEFLFVLPETTLDSGIVVAEKLREAVASAAAASEGSDGMSVTISIGLAELRPPATATATSLIAEADQNLLHAKRSGRNAVVPSPPQI